MQNLNKVAKALNMNSYTGYSNTVATSMTKTLKCGQFSYATLETNFRKQRLP